jgi:hypothetical protein
MSNQFDAANTATSSLLQKNDAHTHTQTPRAWGPPRSCQMPSWTGARSPARVASTGGGGGTVRALLEEGVKPHPILHHLLPQTPSPHPTPTIKTLNHPTKPTLSMYSAPFSATRCIDLT